MLIFENINIAFRSLKANKMRSLLTMIGIIIGIGAVIAIMTVSASLTHSMSESFQEMGANNITVGIQQNSEEEVVKANGMRFGTSGRNMSIEEDDRISDEMIAELRVEYSEEIGAIALSESIGSGTAETGNLSANINATGINDEYFKSSKISLLAGRKIKSADIEGL